jgi:hypothetical protein
VCNDYAREIEAGRVIAAMEAMKGIPPLSYTGGRIPNDAAPTPPFGRNHIKKAAAGCANVSAENLVLPAYKPAPRPIRF